MDFRNLGSDARVASMKKQIIRPLKKYGLIGLELPVQIDLIPEAR
jgi:hypothetical protein